MLNPAREPRATAIQPEVLRPIEAQAPRVLWRDIARCLRVHQWAKNLLVFVPMLAGHRFSLASFQMSFLSFVAFCLTASGTYLLNDLFDLSEDRRHPVKRRRPIASGRVPVRSVLPWVACLWVPAVVLGEAIGPRFFAAQLAYMAATVAYSTVVKRLALVDVLVLAGLYTLRVYAGAFATGIAVSDWLLGFSMFFFLALAFLKRYQEISFRAHGPDGRGYRAEDAAQINILGHMSGMASVLVLTLYVHSREVRLLYARPSVLWLLCPLLLYFLGNLWIRAGRDQPSDDLVAQVLRDRSTWLVGVLSAAILVVATFPS